MLIEQLKRRRQELVDQMRAIRARLETESRSTFTADETRTWTSAKSELGELDERISEIEELEQREGVAESNGRRAAGGDAYRIGGEPRTYSPHSERQGVSFLKDVYAAQIRKDPGAQERLQHHQQEAIAEFGSEFRDVGTGAFSGLVVPAYLAELVAPLRRAGRPFANICNSHRLPAEGMTVNISRITTGSAVLSQATENAAVQETDMDDTLLQVPVVTIAGMQDVSRQAVDRGTGIDTLVIEDLTRAYNAELDRQLISGTGASGQHLGILSTSGLVAVTYTDATPTAPELYPKLFDLVQQVQKGAFIGVSHFVMAPRRWWWLVSVVGTSFPFLQMAGTPTQAGGSVLGTGYGQGPSGKLAPIEVIVDANIPEVLGGGTNEDRILGITDSELHLWEDPGAPLFIRTDEAMANQLSVRFVLFGYSAFTAGRYPLAHGILSGTGFTPPVFA